MLKVNSDKIKIFSGATSVDLSQRICNQLKTQLGKAKVDYFPDGEIHVEIQEDVRGRDCFLILPTCYPVNNNLMELMIFIDTLRRSSAGKIIAVIPYFGYARQDRKDKGRVPITAKLVANLVTKAGADRIIAIDLHAAQIQGFFDIPVDHLSATPVFLEYFNSQREELGDLCLLSPDVGNVKVAESMANLLSGDLAIINKKRVSGSKVVSERRIIGDVKDKTVLMFDDMISTGGTIIEAARIVLDAGAKTVIASATHGVLAGGAVEKLVNSPISRIVVSDTIPTVEVAAKTSEKFSVLSTEVLLAEAIYRVHNNLSVSELFQKTAGVKR